MAVASTLPRLRTKEPWLSEAKQRLSSFASDLGKHQVFTWTGSIAYTTALSLAPFVLILLAIAALLGQDFQNQVYAQMRSLLGAQAGDAVKLVVENADNKPGLSTISGIIGFLVLAVSASAIFSQFRSALDFINETPPSKIPSGIWGFIKQKFFSLGLVFGFIFLMITSLGVTTLIAALFHGREALLWTAIAFVTNLAIFTVLFSAMFHFLPTEQPRWKHSFIAGACATVFFLVGKHLIGLYLGNASVGSAYGAAGTFVVFLVWVYYTAMILLVSYEFANHMFIGPQEKNRTQTLAQSR